MLSRSICGLSLILAIGFADHATAGQVYGTVVGNNGPIKNTVVRIVCPNAQAQRSTDNHGTYSVYVNGSGRCSITVGNSQPLSIRVYDDEVRYDLRLSGNQLQLK